MKFPSSLVENAGSFNTHGEYTLSTIPLKFSFNACVCACMHNTTNDCRHSVATPRTSNALALNTITPPTTQHYTRDYTLHRYAEHTLTLEI